MKDEGSPARGPGIFIVLFLLVLVGFSTYLALNRIYQVDECQNTYTARILASGWTGRFTVNIEIFHLWPLAWIAGLVQGSANLYHGLRLAMLCVFWLNILLMAHACGVSWRTRSFSWILLGAATLAPLWDYGFEIRHDNILLLALLLYWSVLRSPRPSILGRSFLLGALAAFTQFVTFKAFVFWIPLAAMFLLLPPPGFRERRLKIASLWAGGFLTASAMVMLIYLLKGESHRFLSSIGLGLTYSADGQARFYPWATLWRLVYQTPLLSGLAVAALAVEGLRALRRKEVHAVWEGAAPEAVLFLLAVGMLLVNPAPYPYNLVLLVPFGFLLAIRWALQEPWLQAFTQGEGALIGVTLLAFTHLLPFVKATLRHGDWPNDRQEKLMALAEAMTDPALDRVYDASGLVASRQSPGQQWFLHSLLMKQFREGRIPSLKSSLTDHPASVLIPSYRFTWLSNEDTAFIQANYVALAGDYFVLGAQLQPSGPTFRCIYAGRYYIQSTPANGHGGDGPVRMDGKPVHLPMAVPLDLGDHAFSWPQDQSLTICWLGPRLASLPPIGPGNFNAVFVNWY